ncbi:MAG: ATP-binding protein, partial [Ilumatobacter sp.]|nr:ATP-binding protein [Ilumatobacter sp.]
MDWYVPNDTEVVRPLRLALGEHLERHAAAGSDVEGAVLAASELITNAIQNSDGPVWVSLDWGRKEPVLTVHDLGTGFTLEGVPEPAIDQVDGRGLMIANHLVSELTVRAKRPGGSSVSAVLPV